MDELLYIFGCGGHARSIINTRKRSSKECSIILVDPNCKEEEKILGCNTLKNNIFFEKYAKKGFKYIVAIGDNVLRKEIYKKLSEEGGKAQCVCADSALVGMEAILGEGTYIAEKAYLGPQVVVGCNAIVNTGAIIEHETRIGSHTHVAPGSVVCGRCMIGNNVFVGAGSRIVDKITVVDDVVIGAGSVVVQDILEKGTYVGCPAKKIHD